MNIVSLLGSPSARSRSATLLQHAQSVLLPHVDHLETLAVRDLPAQVLLLAQFHDPAVVEAVAKVKAADVVLVSTPIYKAAYSGLLKTFLDLLPQDGLHGKTVLPLATGGSPAHLLALDYALKPVLSALGARDILDGVFASDAQIPDVPGHGYRVSDEVAARVERALQGVIARAERERAAQRALATAASAAPVLAPLGAGLRWAV